MCVCVSVRARAPFPMLEQPRARTSHLSGLNSSGWSHSLGERCRFQTLMKMSEFLGTCAPTQQQEGEGIGGGRGPWV